MFKLKKDKLNKKGLALSKSKGFTLIEMMVSVSIFVIVAFIVVSTLLTMSYAYKKAQKMRLLMDNLNFSLQSMSLNIREGIDYEIANTWIKFKPIDSWINNDNKYVCYSLSDQDPDLKSYIEKCSGSNLSCPCTNENSRFTSPDIDITNLQFTLNENSSLVKRNKVKIIIKGEAGTVSREKTSFFIQNTVSQRNDNDQ